MFHTYYTCIKDIKKTTTASTTKFKFFTKIDKGPFLTPLGSGFISQSYKCLLTFGAQP